MDEHNREMMLRGSENTSLEYVEAVLRKYAGSGTLMNGGSEHSISRITVFDFYLLRWLILKGRV